uniref:Uncharacterized protein n=1 Tax=Myoviridae sp. ctxi06 TaxID=2826713 RepID=A0A8S5R2A9_9CAUD|nr:MAG TPA: hypothetical protein [Myoviridae sp. ctxi06]
MNAPVGLVLTCSCLTYGYIIITYLGYCQSKNNLIRLFC